MIEKSDVLEITSPLALKMLSILPALEKTRNHSDGFIFAVNYHELYIKWLSDVGNPETSALRAEREIEVLLSRAPAPPSGGELGAIISLFDTAADVASPTRLKWLERLGAEAEKSIRAGEEPYDHFWNLLNARRYAAAIATRRSVDPTAVDGFATGLDEYAALVKAAVRSDSDDARRRRGLVDEWLDGFHQWQKRTATDARTPALVGELAPPLTGSWATKQSAPLEELRGRVVVIDFWAIWCEPCVAQFPKLKKLYGDFAHPEWESPCGNRRIE